MVWSGENNYDYIYIYSEESELLNRENQSGVTPALGAWRQLVLFHFNGNEKVACIHVLLCVLNPLKE